MFTWAVTRPRVAYWPEALNTDEKKTGKNLADLLLTARQRLLSPFPQGSHADEIDADFPKSPIPNPESTRFSIKFLLIASKPSQSSRTHHALRAASRSPEFWFDSAASGAPLIGEEVVVVVVGAAMAASTAAAVAPDWWNDVNNSPMWQDRSFHALATLYGAVSFVALVSPSPTGHVRIDLGFEKHGLIIGEDIGSCSRAVWKFRL